MQGAQLARDVCRVKKDSADRDALSQVNAVEACADAPRLSQARQCRNRQKSGRQLHGLGDTLIQLELSGLERSNPPRA